VLLGVDDVAVVFGDETGDCCHHATLVGARQEQDPGS
jgi:hypothetical protein